MLVPNMDDQRNSLQEELSKIDTHLEQIDRQLNSLLEKQEHLVAKKNKIFKKLENPQEAEEKPATDWKTESFPWSEKLRECLCNVFRMTSFRELQLEAINVTMSKRDCLLVMPTSGGKSLCFQLPALVSDGFTLVISPLVSLMEDQLISLQELNIHATMLCASSTRSHVTQTQNEMDSKKSNMKLLYVTPEKISKSKRFMAKLEKAYKAKTIDRIVIDEVHCASQWGHDFRPDYKFLGIFKRQFPGLPILGLTATASAKVIEDVKDMLSLDNCITFRASFNRPNLFYEVHHTSKNKEDLVEEIADKIKSQFSNKSGIVYCFSRKDSEEVAALLNSHGLPSHCYHSDIAADVKTQVHRAWVEGQLQVVVATIAFGMGIDKADVCFVIHFSMSKSVENYYQESGRAGRNGEQAHCILYYKFNDLSRQSSMVYAEKTGLEKLHHMLRYCVEQRVCRRKIISSEFDEKFDSLECNQMCENCLRTEFSSIELLDDATTLVSVIERSSSIEERLTFLKLVEIWMGKGRASLRPDKIATYSRETCEMIVSQLIVHQVLREDFHFTPYTIITYLLPGPRWKHFKNGVINVSLDMVKEEERKDIPSTLLSNGNSSSSGKGKRKRTVVISSDEES